MDSHKDATEGLGSSVGPVALLPCPFCGGQAGFCADDSYGSCHIGCNDEDCVGYHRAFDVWQLGQRIDQWNTRRTPAISEPPQRDSDVINKTTGDFGSPVGYADFLGERMMSIEKRIEERWEAGVPHNAEAKQIVRAIAEYLPSWNIKFGGDGDTGEDLQYALSLWVEDGKPDFVPEWDKSA